MLSQLICNSVCSVSPWLLLHNRPYTCAKLCGELCIAKGRHVAVLSSLTITSSWPRNSLCQVNLLQGIGAVQSVLQVPGLLTFIGCGSVPLECTQHVHVCLLSPKQHAVCTARKLQVHMNRHHNACGADVSHTLHNDNKPQNQTMLCPLHVDFSSSAVYTLWREVCACQYRIDRLPHAARLVRIWLSRFGTTGRCHLELSFLYRTVYQIILAYLLILLLICGMFPGWTS